MSFDSSQFKITCSAVHSTIRLTGGSREHGDRVQEVCDRVFTRTGLRGFSTMIKSWSQMVRALLSRHQTDFSRAGYCKSARNSVHAFRRAGLNQTEISLLIEDYEGIAGFPPILFEAHYLRALLPSATLLDFKKVLPFGNLARTSPGADSQKCNEGLDNFFSTVEKEWESQFDFSNFSTRYASLCKVPFPSVSRWEASTSSSFDYSSSKGGKLGEVIDKVVHEFMHKTIGELLPDRPLTDVYDPLGHLFLKCDDWDPADPVWEKSYPEYGSGEPLDQRFGLFGVLWSYYDLRERFPKEMSSDSPYFALAQGFTPKLQFWGKIPCRVEPLSEEGWKARVVTITPLSVAILQIVLRHVLDPFMRADPNVKIGLLSKVKLYDFMVALNHGRDGVDSDGKPSFYFTSCESVDLTTATDSPYRKGVSTILRPFVSRVLDGRITEFSDFVLDLCLSEREFSSKRLTRPLTHRCGIMMGEALSGVYLNVMSGIIRSTVGDFASEFDFYDGSSVEDADDFIRDNIVEIQEWLDSYVIPSFEGKSTQSGDDVVMFDDDGPGHRSRFLILLYRVFGLIPSETTFYSSDRMGTFTEEFCVKNEQTQGWTFVDILKPRLFLPGSTDGLESILSRIRQITSLLRYQSEDCDFVYSVSDEVDHMIDSIPALRDRIRKYGIPLSLPAFLGGLDHPIQHAPDGYDSLTDDDRDYVCRLHSCSEEEFLEVKYHWVLEDQDSSERDESRELLRFIYHSFLGLCEGEDGQDILPLHLYNEDLLIDRSQFVGRASYSLELEKRKRSFDLATLDDIISSVFSAHRFLGVLNEEPATEIHPMRVLRNRREFLISRTSSFAASEAVFCPEMVRELRFRFMTSYKNKVTQKRVFLEVLGLDNLPSLSIPI